MAVDDLRQSLAARRPQRDDARICTARGCVQRRCLPTGGAVLPTATVDEAEMFQSKSRRQLQVWHVPVAEKSSKGQGQEASFPPSVQIDPIEQSLMGIGRCAKGQIHCSLIRRALTGSTWALAPKERLGIPR